MKRGFRFSIWSMERHTQHGFGESVRFCIGVLIAFGSIRMLRVLLVLQPCWTRGLHGQCVEARCGMIPAHLCLLLRACLYRGVSSSCCAPSCCSCRARRHTCRFLETITSSRMASRASSIRRSLPAKRPAVPTCIAHTVMDCAARRCAVCTAAHSSQRCVSSRGRPLPHCRFRLPILIVSASPMRRCCGRRSPDRLSHRPVFMRSERHNVSFEYAGPAGIHAADPDNECARSD